MALLDEPFIRELVAFPKNQAGLDPMSGAPTPVEPAQLQRARDRRQRQGRRERAPGGRVPRRRSGRFLVEALFLAGLAAPHASPDMRPAGGGRR